MPDLRHVDMRHRDPGPVVVSRLKGSIPALQLGEDQHNSPESVNMRLQMLPDQINRSH